MIGSGSAAVLVKPRAEGTLTLATRVGTASGSKAAAAALACAGSDPDRAGLLIVLSDDRAPHPSLVASGAARRLEERLAAHLPDARVASRGWICQLTLPSAVGSLELLGGVAAIARDSTAVVHLPPQLLQTALGETGMRPSGALLRADLDEDRALTALLARDLLERSVRVAVLKHPLGWIVSRRALSGTLSADAGGALSARMSERLLGCPAPQ
jgi:hypothetical protein